MKNIFKISLIAAFASFIVSCETTELELLENPNDITVESADPNFVLNDIQVTFLSTIGDYNGTSMAITRMINMFSTYGIDAQTLNNGAWEASYQMFANIDLLNGINSFDLESTGEGIPYHVAMGQILEAYAYMLLVDYLGDVPYSQANNPEEFPLPGVDPGALVYDAQLALLDEAIANLNLSSTKIPTDLYYGNFNAANWIAVANTLKLRAYNNLRLTDPARAREGINSVSSQNFIDNISEDFQFQYGDVVTDVDTRHPFFRGNYLASGAGTYMSNNFFDYLNAGDDQPPFIETGTPDPRLRYYIYRQVGDHPSGSNLPCAGDGSYDYCYVGNFYVGRDHADEAGIPNDAFIRSTYGVYPGGGAFDFDQFVQARATEENLGGAGIFPIFLSSFSKFALAEAALTIGSNGNPTTLLEEGIRLSLDKVQSFGAPVANGTGFEMTTADKNEYVATVMAEYAGANADQKLQIIAREYYLAAFGNGMEVFNLYRRTGKPELQDPIIAAGAFPRVFLYPFDEVENNPNIPQNQVTNQTFWDNNPGGFID